VFVPAAPERIKAINDLIAGVIGLDTQRGDRLVIESLPFDRTVETIDPEQPGFKETGKPQNPLEPLLKDKRFLIGAPAASALMLLATSLLFVKRRKKKKNVAMQKALQEAAARKRAAEEANELAQAQKAALIEEMKLPGVPKKLESLRSQVRETVRKDPQLAAEVIRAWLDEPARIP
jgi:flagellar M-ring protein FliF